MALGGADGYVRLVDARTGAVTGKPMLVMRNSDVIDVAFSPDSRLLAVGDEAGQVRVWNVVTRHLADALNGGDGPIRDVAFGPGSKRLAMIANSSVEVWNLTSRTHITLASDPLEGASGLAVSPNGSTLASVVGCQLRFWDPATGGAIGQPVDLDYVVAHGGGDTDCGDLHTQLSFAADGRAICAIVNSNLSRAEYSAVLPAAPYHRTCA